MNYQHKNDGTFAKKSSGFLRTLVGLIFIGLLVFVLLDVLTHRSKAEVVTPAPADTFEVFFNRKVEEYKQTEAFKKEMADYADKEARVRMLGATITRIEQMAK